MDVVELRLRSAEDLKDVRRVRIGKLLQPALACAWITPAASASASAGPLHNLSTSLPPPHHTSAHLQAATPDDACTLFPTWQPKEMKLHLENARSLSNNFLIIRLYAHRPRSALPTRTKHRLVGSVTIPLADIVSDGGWPTSHNHWQLLSYNVKLPSGQHHGVLNFSARFFSQTCPFQPPMTLSHIPSYLN